MTDQVAMGMESWQMSTLTGRGMQGTTKMMDDGTRRARAGPAESEATLEKSAVYSMRFPKISHAEM
jgi:hypothetical protein